MSDKDLVV